ALALVGALGVVALLVHVAADVALRNLLARPIPATNEIVSRYYMVAMAFLPLAWVERRGGMVRVELIEAALPPGLKRLSELAVAALTLAIYLALAWVSWEHALKQWGVGAFVDVLGRRVIVWPTFFLPAAGFFLAALVVAQRILALLAGRPRP
ncbi:MAG: TRAP transporter small permease, partial [Alphaproteobacteria bacterium]